MSGGIRVICVTPTSTAMTRRCCISTEFGLLFAADTMEDTVTYVAEPRSLDTHLAELDRLWSWTINTILPNHGDPT